MRTVISILCFVPFAILACSTDDNAQSGDGSADAIYDPGSDLCNSDHFFEAGGAGHPCPKASGTLCFADCDGATGCRCVMKPGGPIWQCMNAMCGPEGGPLDDAGPDDSAPPDDTGTVVDTGSDSSDASDAG